MLCKMSEINKESDSISYPAYHHTQNAKTILITNNYTQNGMVGSSTANGSSGATNSITILTTNPSGTEKVDTNVGTVVLDRINICINNHYDSARSASGIGQMPVVNIKTEKTDTESSTNGVMSKETSKYLEGEDVLVLQNDGRFYLGTIIVVAPNQCLVKFDDNTQKWASEKELKRFGSSKTEEEGPLCVVCKTKNDLETAEVCEQCGRGYHRSCTNGSFGANGVWYCRRCCAQNGMEAFRDYEKISQKPPTIRALKSKSQLPYDLDKLKWDSYHRENSEKRYCYCGEIGNWLKQMLQCSRCQQWFHEKCIASVTFPLFCGDRFYVFICSMCNLGSEFLRRLEINWTELVHLLIFNLSMNNSSTKYFDLANTILPYFVDLKEVLQLPAYMYNLGHQAVKDKMEFVLNSDGKRFQQDLITQSWSLTKYEPPQAPFVILPSDEKPMTEQYIRNLWPERKHPLGFVRHTLQNLNAITETKDWKSRIEGRYLFESKQPCNKCDDSEDEIPIKFIIEKGKVVNIHEYKAVQTSTEPTSSSSSLRLDSQENSRDVSDDTTSHDSFITNLHKMKSEENKKRRLRKRPINKVMESSGKKRKIVVPPPEESLNDDDTSSRSTLDFIIPPPRDFEGTNNPFNPTYTSTTPLKVDEKVTVESVEKKQGRKQNKPLNSIAPNNVRIVRTIRRRLSAKDIVIGPNQEVKYKRNGKRKRHGDVEVISTTTINTLSNLASFLPSRSDFQFSTSSRPTVYSATPGHTPGAVPPLIPISNLSCKHPRSCKEKQEKSTNERHSTGSIATPSTSNGFSSLPDTPIRNSTMPILDQEPSMSTYIGSIGHFPNGDKFLVRGRRTDTCGKKQYLIEWSGNNRASLF